MKIVKRRRETVMLLAVGVLVINLAFAVWISAKNALSPIIFLSNSSAAIKQKINKKLDANVSTVPTVSNKPLSNTDPSSIWVVVNKQHPLTPVQYSPADLVTTMGGKISQKVQLDFEKMLSDAAVQGVNITVVSSYRSYDTQISIYNNYVAANGQVATDTFSARPGYSEHQTGFTIDFGSSTNTDCNIKMCYENTVEGQWLANHAYQYGFLLRYTAEKQSVTGYVSEPWHYRYIGINLITKMRNTSKSTLEEYFNISGGETYI